MKSVNLSENALDKEMYESLGKAIKKHPTLEEINLSHTEDPSYSFALFLEKLKKNKPLKTLKLNYNYIFNSFNSNGENFEKLVDYLSENPFLENILLQNTNLSIENFSLLIEKVFPKNTHLKNLDLQHNSICAFERSRDFTEEYVKIFQRAFKIFSIYNKTLEKILFYDYFQSIDSEQEIIIAQIENQLNKNKKERVETNFLTRLFLLNLSDLEFIYS
jgi:Ran GTPase-activating protein (RanGAP) involved in mRNA processing and transport